MIIKKLPVLIFLILFSASAETLSAISGEAEPVSENYRISMTTLLGRDKEYLNVLIEESDPDDYFRLGILYTNKILLSDSIKTLDEAVENLALAETDGKDDSLLRIYKGITEAFLAQKKTFLGVENIKNTEAFMSSVSDSHPDWFIRFLRGISYYRFGHGLPGIGPIKPYKTEALRVGRMDLEYVIKSHNTNSIREYNSADYDWIGRPVPDSAAAFAEDLLK